MHDGPCILKRCINKAITAALSYARQSQEGTGRGEDRYSFHDGDIVVVADFDGYTVTTTVLRNNKPISFEHAENLINNHIKKLTGRGQ